MPRSSVRPPAVHARPHVFAVEDTAAQVTFSALPPGETVVEAGDARAVLRGDGRPAAVVLEGLPPAAVLDLVVNGRRAGRFATLAPPPGRLLCRFATVNDVHVGEDRFGLVWPMRERGAAEAHPVRCLRAALAEAVAWGAEAVVAKGDLTAKGRPREWEAVARLLGEVPVPVEAVHGNHDVKRRASDGHAAVAAAGVGLHDEPTAVDLPGIRLVLACSAVPTRHDGRIDEHQREVLAKLVGEAPGPAFVGLHHQLQHGRWLTYWPPGVPPAESRALLDALAEANPATLVSSGHTHRHRRRHHGPVVVTEVGSTKDYPGTWAGYAVHEGGIRQVVRRVAEPSAIAWTEYTRRAVGGVWGRWSPGPLGARCFTHPWPA